MSRSNPSITDSIVLTLGTFYSVTDDLDNWTDAVLVALGDITQATKSVGDTLANWADAISTSLREIPKLIILADTSVVEGSFGSESLTEGDVTGEDVDAI